MTMKRALVEAAVLRRLASRAARADHLVDHKGIDEQRRHRVASVRPSWVSGIVDDITTREVTAALKRLQAQGWAALNPWSTRTRDKDWILTDPSKPPPTLPKQGHTHQTFLCGTCGGLITLGCHQHIETGHTDTCPDRPEVALKRIKIQCHVCNGEGEYDRNEGLDVKTKKMEPCFTCRASGRVWERLADRVAEREERRLAR